MAIFRVDLKSNALLQTRKKKKTRKRDLRHITCQSQSISGHKLSFSDNNYWSVDSFDFRVGSLRSENF